MQIFSLLNEVTIEHFGQTYGVSLNFIGEIVRGIISGVGIVGVGIILFSLILKFIVLPFDVMQRVSMRKQNQKMQENKDKLEKLQKQYANDKDTYNQKLMEFNKQNGVSLLTSCLPMILSMVIFFVAIGAFNSYAQYAKIENYNYMVTSYNSVIEDYRTEIVRDNIVFEKHDGNVWVVTTDPTQDGEIRVRVQDKNVDTNQNYVYFRFFYDKQVRTDEELVQYVQDVAFGKVYKEGTWELIKPDYFVDAEKAKLNPDIAQYILERTTADNTLDENELCADYIREKARAAVETTYNEVVVEKTQFLWIKNVWVTDAMYKNPVLPYYSNTSGCAMFGNEGFSVMGSETYNVNGMAVMPEHIGYHTSAYGESAYNEITHNLGTQKAEFNGFFILILLSIGTILLQQFITMRAQKAQNQYSSVDGQGGKQQKIMLITMTLMFGFFAFMYSSAFSIYMVTSNIISLLSTLLINKIVDVVLSKQEEKKYQEKHSFKRPAQKDGKKIKEVKVKEVKVKEKKEKKDKK
ncbi:MAG: YidC/Oxa1 family membrane protein insertase [Clostridia bacterium]|nr:YidC/Oxa1 family membrane protein insertase [Clostridia bacterium]